MTAVHRRPYEDGVDLFLVYCPPLETVYVVGIAVALAGLSMLRVRPPANSQRKRINWASDYELGSGRHALEMLPPLTLLAAPE